VGPFQRLNRIPVMVEYLAAGTAAMNLTSRLLARVCGRPSSERAASTSTASARGTLHRQAHSTEVEQSHYHTTGTETRSVKRRQVNRTGSMTIGCRSNCMCRRRRHQKDQRAARKAALSSTGAAPSESSGSPYYAAETSFSSAATAGSSSSESPVREPSAASVARRRRHKLKRRREKERRERRKSLHD